MISTRVTAAMTLALAAFAAFAAPALAADEGPISTARAAPAPVAVAAAAVEAPPAAAAPAASQDIGAQIADYLASSPAALPEDPYGVVADEAPDRKVHGEVSVAVGSHGYRSLYARSDMPVGKTGTVSIAVGETRGRGPYGYGYGYGYGPYGYAPYGHGYDLGYGYGRGRSQSLGLAFSMGGAGRDAERCRDLGEMDQASRLERDCRPLSR